MAFVKVASLDEIPVGRMRKVTAGSEEVLLSNIGGKVYGISAVCSHMKGDLSKGTLDGDVVTCPKHSSQYDVTSGKVLQGPKIAFLKLKGKDVKAYEGKVEGNDLLVNVG